MKKYSLDHFSVVEKNNLASVWGRDIVKFCVWGVTDRILSGCHGKRSDDLLFVLKLLLSYLVRRPGTLSLACGQGVVVVWPPHHRPPTWVKCSSECIFLSSVSIGPRSTHRPSLPKMGRDLTCAQDRCACVHARFNVSLNPKTEVFESEQMLTLSLRKENFLIERGSKPWHCVQHSIGRDLTVWTKIIKSTPKIQDSLILLSCHCLN